MNLVIKHNEKPMTTSLRVAEIFEKQHNNIIEISKQFKIP